MADGGDGSLELLESYYSLSRVPIKTLDPLGREIDSYYAMKGPSALIEIASASGYVLLDENEKNPMYTSTRGTGIMVKHAIENGCQDIQLFLGGSATNDAGTGILDALGFEFLDDNGERLEPIGKNLMQINSISMPDNYEDLKAVRFTLLCDVNNPLYGPSGAAHTYAKQKGASDEEILLLDQGLMQFSSSLEQQFDKRIGDIPGVGAAGGIPAALLAFLNCKLTAGTDAFIEITGVENELSSADYIITGEGRLDDQSLLGKVPGGMYKLAQEYNIPCAFLVGHSTLKHDEFSNGTIMSILSEAESTADAMKNASKYLERIAIKLAQTFE